MTENVHVLYRYSYGGYWASGTQTLSCNDSDEVFLSKDTSSLGSSEAVP